MNTLTRTATIQARVVPAIKEASERVLRQIGLNMSEAMELFLRRIILDQRLPFDVVALDMTHIGARAGEKEKLAKAIRDVRRGP